MSFSDPRLQSEVDAALAKIRAAEIALIPQREAAVERALEYGTEVRVLARPRGDGWFAATSHSLSTPDAIVERVCHLDLATGEPVMHQNGTYCECDAGQAGVPWCHHHGAAWLWWRAQPQPMSLEETLAASVELARQQRGQTAPHQPTQGGDL